MEATRLSRSIAFILAIPVVVGVLGVTPVHAQAPQQAPLVDPTPVTSYALRPLDGAAGAARVQATMGRRGASVADATRQGSDWQFMFNTWVTELEAAYPGEFTAASIVSPTSGMVAFKAEVPDAVVGKGRRLGGVTFLPRSGYSARAVDVATAATMARFGSAPGFSGLAVDMSSGSMSISFQKPSQVIDAARILEELRATRSLERAFESAGEAVPAMTVGIGVGSSVSESWLAGQALYANQAPYCSTAVPVKRNGGSEIGILTAGHCSGRGVRYSDAQATCSAGPETLRRERICV